MVSVFELVMGRTMLPKDERVRVRSMFEKLMFEYVRCNLVNLVKAPLSSKLDVRSFKAKNRVFEFDDQQMNMFKFVRCSKNDVRVRSMFDKKVFDTSLV